MNWPPFDGSTYVRVRPCPWRFSGRNRFEALPPNRSTNILERQHDSYMRSDDAVGDIETASVRLALVVDVAAIIGLTFPPQSSIL